MQTYVQVDKGVVIAAVQSNQCPVGYELAPADVQPGMMQAAGGSFEWSPEQRLKEKTTAVANALALIDHEKDKALAQLKAGYTPEEIETWSQQAAEAAEHANGAVAGDLSLLSSMAAESGESLDDIAAMVRAKAVAKAKASGKILGAARAAKVRVRAVDLESEDWRDQLQIAMQVDSPTAE